MAFGTGSKSSFCPLLTAPARHSSAALPFPCPAEDSVSVRGVLVHVGCPRKVRGTCFVQKTMKSVKFGACASTRASSQPFPSHSCEQHQDFTLLLGSHPGVSGSRVPLGGGSAQKAPWRGGRGWCWAWPEVLRSSGGVRSDGRAEPSREPQRGGNGAGPKAGMRCGRGSASAPAGAAAGPGGSCASGAQPEGKEKRSS